jgi:Uma2 family endonuclease
LATETRISNEAYERLALAQPDRKWELWHGHPREKPGMTAAHNEVAYLLGLMLGNQLDRSEYRVRIDAARVHRPASTSFIPDVFVVPTASVRQLLPRRDVLEEYAEPLPLVVEVWSPSTADYDLTEKLEVYMRRGDAEIWLIHPYDRTLTAWRRRPDGSYDETVFTEGIVHPMALPGVVIDLAVLFDL